MARTQQSDATPPAAIDPASPQQEIQELRSELARLSARLDALESSESKAATRAAVEPAQPVEPNRPDSGVMSAPPPAPVTAENSQPSLREQSAAPIAASMLPTNLPGGATLNYTFDGYYEFNFNRPPGRVNDLRSYDVLSNVFSVNQADLVLDLQPDVEKGRRYGLRLDLQFGQATGTLQGNPVNEARPEIYRNIFQAYGTYVIPVGKGINVDFGKWASSLGIEGNYTKDQMNYTRSFYFSFLPFYHAGVRTSYHVDDKFAVNYWLVNGSNQAEPTNGYKDEMFGFVLQPSKAVTWTSNYYNGQEHADSAPASNCTIPLQPGLCVSPISPAPNGKLHIFDNYLTWQARPKLSVAGEADYVIEREWKTSAPGESSSPSHVIGGAAYAQYQVTPRGAFAVRGEYLSDRGGLFSGTTQALKEGTGTYKYTLGDGLDAFMEFRGDWTNVPYFTTHTVGAPSSHQSTATLGLVWWYGGKQAPW